MARRYLFLCTEGEGASGGKAVIYDAVAELIDLGYDAQVLVGSGGGYPAGNPKAEEAYSRRLSEAFINHLPSIARLRGQLGVKRRELAQSLKSIEVSDEDVLVVPEILISTALIAFPNNPKVLLAQGPFLHRESHFEAVKRGLNPAGSFFFAIGIADISDETFALLGLDRTARVPVSMHPDRFEFGHKKERLITYMPRRRPAEAELIASALRRRGNIADYRVEAIDGMPMAQVAGSLTKSLVFISLLQTEGLGFPAAEAMASGALVVGYTGTGAEEYFDTSTGFPIPEGRTLQLVETVEAIIRDYEADPAPLDRIRAHASETVRSRYAYPVFQQALKAAWSEIDAALT